MKNEITIDNVNFWVDENIIFCRIGSDFDEFNKWNEIDDIFQYAISILSNGKYLPILIDLRETNYSLSIKIFKFLSFDSAIKTFVLSKTFLVNSYVLKALLLMYNFSASMIVPNSVFTDFNSALEDCNKNYSQFNSVSLE
jgi:hypothetical protein